MNLEIIEPARKLELLSLIHPAMGCGKRTTGRAIGMTQTEIKALVSEELFEFSYTSSNPKWEDCRIERLYPKALAMVPRLATKPNYPSLRNEPALPRGFWLVLILAVGGGNQLVSNPLSLTQIEVAAAQSRHPRGADEGPGVAWRNT